MTRYSIIYFGDVWDEQYRRRQEMALGISKDNRVEKVIYVELPLTVVSLMKYFIGIADKDSKERWSRVFSMGVFWKKSDKFYVMTPVIPIPPVAFGLLWIISRYVGFWFTKILVKHFADKIGLNNIVTVITMPHLSTELAGCFGEKLMIYDCSEEYRRQMPCHNKGMSYLKMIEKNDIDFTIKADIIFVNSEKLYEIKKNINQNTHLCLNAVKEKIFEEFETHKRSVVNELMNIRRPILGYIGHLTAFVDIDLLLSLSQARGNWSIVIIGEKDNNQEIRELEKHKNIYLIGKKPFCDLPRYINNFDICLGLYKMTDINQSNTSLKYPLYLASGKPVVSTDAGGARQFLDTIYLANSSSEYIDCIEKALSENSGYLRDKRIQTAKQNTWEKRVKEIISIIDTAYRQKYVKFL